MVRSYVARSHYPIMDVGQGSSIFKDNRVGNGVVRGKWLPRRTTITGNVSQNLTHAFRVSR